jgi:hypothetical protein
MNWFCAVWPDYETGEETEWGRICAYLRGLDSFKLPRLG